MIMNKRNLLIIGALVAALAVIVIAVRVRRDDPGQVIKIGAILPLTGPLAQLQDQLKSGMELAVKEINDSGGINGKKLVIVYQDNQNDPRQSVSAFQQLITQESVPIIISDHSPLSTPL